MKSKGNKKNRNDQKALHKNTLLFQGTLIADDTVISLWQGETIDPQLNCISIKMYILEPYVGKKISSLSPKSDTKFLTRIGERKIARTNILA